jgi:hypothetical protein
MQCGYVRKKNLNISSLKIIDGYSVGCTMTRQLGNFKDSKTGKADFNEGKDHRVKEFKEILLPV